MASPGGPSSHLPHKLRFKHSLSVETKPEPEELDEHAAAAAGMSLYHHEYRQPERKPSLELRDEAGALKKLLVINFAAQSSTEI